jgi:hypothetical protein
MSNKKLEEVFNLPPIEDIDIPLEDDDSEEEMTMEEIQHEIEEYQGQMSVANRVDAALPVQQGLDQLEREMDEYAAKAMGTFQDLVDLGHNVEDRNAAPIFDSASKMLSAALQAKQAKIDKKLKMMELQQRQAKLELETRKLEHQIAKEESKSEDRAETIEGKIVGDRASMIADIMANMNKK